MKMYNEIKLAFEDRYIMEPNSGCWVWIGNTIKRGGYGAFTMRPAGIYMQRAHRLAWKLYRSSDISEDVHVLHKCDNRLCVNPDHLFLGDQAANIRDMKTKGRQAKGDRVASYRHGRYVGAKRYASQAARVR